MTAPDERFTITLPDTWTPEQALAIFELLNDVTDAIWQSYQPALLSLADPLPLRQRTCTSRIVPSSTAILPVPQGGKSGFAHRETVRKFTGGIA